jgi:hypothetical protein
LGPLVTIEAPGGRVSRLRPGDFIGRMPTAALYLNDPRVSEAHAMVSLRSSRLRLISLRGRFSVAGRTLTEVALEPGLVIEIAEALTVTVRAVELPATVLALSGAQLDRLVPPPVASISAGPVLEVLPGFVRDAAAVIWSDGGAFYLRRPGQADECYGPGDELVVGEHRLVVVELELQASGANITAANPSTDDPLVLIIRYDTAHLWRGGEKIAIDGIPARILSELGSMGVPVEWRTLSGLLWPDESDARALRQRLDAALARLRKRLRDARIRPDLVRTDRAGNVELFLGPHDRVEDAT